MATDEGGACGVAKGRDPAVATRWGAGEPESKKRQRQSQDRDIVTSAHITYQHVLIVFSSPANYLSVRGWG